jgi:hypothetical protein
MTINFLIESNALINAVVNQDEESIKKNLNFIGEIDSKGRCAYDYAKLSKNSKIIDLISQYEYNIYDEEQQ